MQSDKLSVTLSALADPTRRGILARLATGEATVNERERRLSLPILKELESTCDFEAHVTWVLGMASPNRYRVQELSNPARLIVDVRH